MECKVPAGLRIAKDANYPSPVSRHQSLTHKANKDFFLHRLCLHTQTAKAHSETLILSVV